MANKNIINGKKSTSNKTSKTVKKVETKVEVATPVVDDDVIVETPVVEAVEEVVETPMVKTVSVSSRKFQPGDMIECRCVMPNSVIFYSSKTDTRYEFAGYGDVNEVDYADLTKLKASRSSILFQPKILIEDEDLRNQWRKDFAEIDDEYEGIYDTDSLFEKDPDEFEKFLRKASSGVKELVRTSASGKIKDGSLSDLKIIRAIDDILGTQFKEFV